MPATFTAAPDLALPRRLVIDTNVLLDWLVFGNPCAQAMIAALQTRSAVWLATEPMLEELRRVLQYPALAVWEPNLAAIESLISAYVFPCRIPERSAPSQCRDADDQKYLDLAWTQQVDQLLSKDKLLLKAARRCKLRVGPHM